jgi:hypothetical protein
MVSRISLFYSMCVPRLALIYAALLGRVKVCVEGRYDMRGLIGFMVNVYRSASNLLVV